MWIELCSSSDGENAVGRTVPRVLIDRSRNVNGVECVSNREDTGLDWNKGASYPVRVSCSIPSLMVVGDDNRGASQKAVRLKAFSAHSWMRLAAGIGLNVETSCLRNQIEGQGQQPDVVEQCGKRQVVQRFAR